MKMQPIILASGGTGGHVFPAQALVEELLSRNVQPIILTDKRGMVHFPLSNKVLVFNIRSGNVASKSITGKFRALCNLTLGYWQARQLLNRFSPGAVIGFGGYPTLPTMLAATHSAMPIVIHEQNAILGKVNRVFSKKAKVIATSFAGTCRENECGLANVVCVGNPVRKAFLSVRGMPYAVPADDGPIRLVILGGSQGATIFSKIIPKALAALPSDIKTRLLVSQQCRPEDIEGVRNFYNEIKVSADLSTFFMDIPERLGSAHMVIARAGASTISELMILGRPSILIPYSKASDDHQSMNAGSVSDEGAALPLAEQDLSPSSLSKMLTSLLRDPLQLEKVASKARNMGQPNATMDLADTLCSVLSDSSLSESQKLQESPRERVL